MEKINKLQSDYTLVPGTKCAKSDIPKGQWKVEGKIPKERDWGSSPETSVTSAGKNWHPTGLDQSHEDAVRENGPHFPLLIKVSSQIWISGFPPSCFSLAVTKDGEERVARRPGKKAPMRGFPLRPPTQQSTNAHPCCLKQLFLNPFQKSHFQEVDFLLYPDNLRNPYPLCFTLCVKPYFYLWLLAFCLRDILMDSFSFWLSEKSLYFTCFFERRFFLEVSI